jgi:carbamate kinase
MDSIDVIALGGNAILPAGKAGTIGEQISITRTAMEQIVGLVSEGRHIVLTHGNGPIVGNIVVRNEAARHTIPPMPLDVCGADSQGGIGYMMQQTVRNVLREKNIDRDVVSLITQVEVDANDPAFKNPVKPIGPFYNEEQAKQLRAEMGWSMVKVYDKGYRRVVPSPYPIKIIEKDVIKRLVTAGVITITVGGGGIPVVYRDGAYRGTEAVIDKDLASSLLARELQAERFFILTDVDAVYRDFASAKAAAIRHVSVEEMKELHDQGQFPDGSMGSKVQAAIEFLEFGGEAVIITTPQDFREALEGKKGTRISGSHGS